MKFEAVTLCYNDEGTIGATIRCLKPFVNKHWIVMSEKPYFGEGAKPDRSEEICRGLGAKVVKGVWALDHFQRNAGQALCSADWVFTFDSDELVTAEGAESLIKCAEKTTADAILNTPEVYWYDVDHILYPRSTYSPPIMCRSKARFTYIRNLACSMDSWDGTMHHLSWCKPKDIRKKVLNYAHANDFKDADKWYTEKFEQWKEGEDAIMPDGKAFPTKRQPLPQELKDLL